MTTTSGGPAGGENRFPGSRQSQETAGLKGSNVPSGLFFQIGSWNTTYFDRHEAHGLVADAIFPVVEGA